jgi:hypothetical protein
MDTSGRVLCFVGGLWHPGVMPTSRNSTPSTTDPEYQAPQQVPVDVVGGWGHSIWTVAEMPGFADFWGYAQLTEEELTARVRAAGRIADEFALQADTALDGFVRLTDGAHRWAVAKTVGLVTVPVQMTWERDWGTR